MRLLFLSVLVSAGIVLGLRPHPFCANSISCIKNLGGAFEENKTKAVFLGKEVAVSKSLTQTKSAEPSVLGDSSAKKLIYVDLSSQHLYAFEDNTLRYDFLISSGKWAKTPTGTFHIWAKTKYTHMTGGNKVIGTYYDLPNVPDSIFFFNEDVPKSQGFSVHGAYWHTNFGHPMSHGCINLSLDAAEKLYDWVNPASSGLLTYTTTTNPGTDIIIYGEAPANL